MACGSAPGEGCVVYAEKLDSAGNSLACVYLGLLQGYEISENYGVIQLPIPFEEEGIVYSNLTPTGKIVVETVVPDAVNVAVGTGYRDKLNSLKIADPDTDDPLGYNKIYFYCANGYAWSVEGVIGSATVKQNVQEMGVIRLRVEFYLGKPVATL